MENSKKKLELCAVNNIFDLSYFKRQQVAFRYDFAQIHQRERETVKERKTQKVRAERVINSQQRKKNNIVQTEKMTAITDTRFLFYSKKNFIFFHSFVMLLNMKRKLTIQMKLSRFRFQGTTIEQKNTK